jgi:hypothetical protein
MFDEKTDDDVAMVALDHLASAAEQSVNEIHAVQRDLDIMKEQRKRGWSWRRIVAEPGVPQPLTRVARLAAHLATAGGAFRRALARALRAEGMQVNGIADIFGVSRQRISTLVRADATTPERDLP